MQLIVVLMLLLEGCVAGSMASPRVAPNGNTEFYLSDVEPKVETDINLWLFRYMKWKGLEEFTSLIICPTGVPGEGERKHCLQMYNGVKVDGSDARWRQGNGDMRWGYVYKSEEQSSVRWHMVVGGKADVYNMAGQ